MLDTRCPNSYKKFLLLQLITALFTRYCSSCFIMVTNSSCFLVTYSSSCHLQFQHYSQKGHLSKRSHLLSLSLLAFGVCVSKESSSPVPVPVLLFRQYQLGSCLTVQCDDLDPSKSPRSENISYLNRTFGGADKMTKNPYYKVTIKMLSSITRMQTFR